MKTIHQQLQWTQMLAIKSMSHYPSDIMESNMLNITQIQSTIFELKQLRYVCPAMPNKYI